MGRARVFGDLNDPKSAISKLMAENKTVTWRDDYGTKPMVFFIAPDMEVFKNADGQINKYEVIEYATYPKKCFEICWGISRDYSP